MRDGGFLSGSCCGNNEGRSTVKRGDPEEETKARASGQQLART